MREYTRVSILGDDVMFHERYALVHTAHLLLETSLCEKQLASWLPNFMLSLLYLVMANLYLKTNGFMRS